MEDRLWRPAAGVRGTRSGVAPVTDTARVFDEQFAHVYDLAWHLAASEEDAGVLTRDVFVRMPSDKLVRVQGDIAGQLAATAYHIAAARPGRTTQPTGARSHALARGSVVAINAHAARCRACRRWGPLPFGDVAARSFPLPMPYGLKASIWREISTAACPAPTGLVPFPLQNLGLVRHAAPPFATRSVAGAAPVAPRTSSLFRAIRKRRALLLFSGAAALLLVTIGAIGVSRILRVGAEGGGGPALAAAPIAPAPIAPPSTAHESTVATSGATGVTAPSLVRAASTPAAAIPSAQTAVEAHSPTTPVAAATVTVAGRPSPQAIVTTARSEAGSVRVAASTQSARPPAAVAPPPTPIQAPRGPKVPAPKPETPPSRKTTDAHGHDGDNGGDSKRNDD